MKRYCALEDISDGKLYDSEDLAEVSCNGCRGAASCCHGMGDSIILDPLDVYELTSNLKMTFQELMADRIELRVVDGMILPNLKMTGPGESCVFLNEKGRCGIHSFRPGICRMFPLGRYYEGESFRYFLQTGECKNSSRTMAKIKKWIDIPDWEKNQKFISDWHYFLKSTGENLSLQKEEDAAKRVNMYLLNLFFLKEYEGERGFYIQFQERLKEAGTILGVWENG